MNDFNIICIFNSGLNKYACCSAVRPLLSIKLALLPDYNKYTQISKWPNAAAFIKAVSPLIDYEFISSIYPFKEGSGFNNPCYTNKVTAVIFPF